LDPSLRDRMTDGAVMAIINIVLAVSSHFAIWLAGFRSRHDVMVMQGSGEQRRDINQQGENGSCWSIGH
jgi:hypothetical protein